MLEKFEKFEIENSQLIYGGDRIGMTETSTL